MTMQKNSALARNLTRTSASLLALFVASTASAETRDFDLNDFKAVHVSAGISAKISIAEDFSVVLEGSEKSLKRAHVHVKDGELRVGRRTGRVVLGFPGKITATITAPRLSALSVSSGAGVNAKGIDAGDFRLDASSGGILTVSGVCDGLRVDASSGANIRGEEFKCRTASADASSGSSARIYANEEADAEASSGASVRVYGDPETRSSETSSGGSVRFN